PEGVLAPVDGDADAGPRRGHGAPRLPLHRQREERGTVDRPVILSVLWRLRVWHVLVLAFAVRFAVGLATDSVLQPDEVMQYLEQAHRLVFGAGLVPWEYEYGTRTWAPA